MNITIKERKLDLREEVFVPYKAPMEDVLFCEKTDHLGSDRYVIQSIRNGAVFHIARKDSTLIDDMICLARSYFNNVLNHRPKKVIFRHLSLEQSKECCEIFLDTLDGMIAESEREWWISRRNIIDEMAKHDNEAIAIIEKELLLPCPE